MRLHESIIWSVEEETLSGINIYCDSSKSREIADFFEENFNKYWEEAKDAVEEEYGDCVEKDEDGPSVATVSVADYGVKVVLEPLYLSYQGGDYIESEGYAGKALDKTLAKLLKTYPEVSYEGCMAYTWSDVHCGEAECWQISSKDENPSEDKVYDFIGETLSREMYDPEFWEKMSDNLEDGDIDDFKHVLCNFCDYKKWIPDDSIDQLLNIAGEIDEDIRSELEEVVDTVNRGEKIETKRTEIDTSDLPEGYIDALNAVIKSENTRKKAEIDAELEAEKLSMLIGYCDNCKYIDLINEKSECKCPRCSGVMRSLGINSKEWNLLPNEAKFDPDKVAEKAKEIQRHIEEEKALRIEKTSVSINDKNPASDSVRLPNGSTMIHFYIDGDVADYLGENWESFEHSENKKDIAIDVTDYATEGSTVTYSSDNRMELSVYRRYEYMASKTLSAHAIMDNEELEEVDNKTVSSDMENVLWHFSMADTLNDYMFTEKKVDEFSSLKEDEGVLLQMDNGKLKSTIVRGKTRPALLCKSLKGTNIMCRPYPDEDGYKCEEYSEEEFDNESEYLSGNDFHFSIDTLTKSYILEKSCTKHTKTANFTFDIIEQPIRVIVKSDIHNTKIFVCKRQNVGASEENAAFTITIDWDNNSKVSTERKASFGSNDNKLLQDLLCVESWLDMFCIVLARMKKYKDYNPESQCVLLQKANDEFLNVIVEGKERPDLACYTFGGLTMARPYMDEMYENFINGEE